MVSVQRLGIAIGFLLLAVSFLAFWTILERDSPRKKFSRLTRVAFARIVFVAGAGILPALLLPHSSGLSFPFGFSPKLPLIVIAMSVAAGIAAFFIGLYAPKDRRALDFYPIIGKGPWAAKEWISDIGGWAAYLAAYEFAFRCYVPWLLVIAGLDYFSAATVAIVLYAFAHIHKGAKEAWLCLPFGALLHASVYYGGSLWPAFLIHLGLAIGNDMGILRKTGNTSRRSTP